MIARGSREATRRASLLALEGLGDAQVAWLSADEETRFVHRPSARSLLGRAFDAVVLDLHDGLDADLLGQAHGLVWGGGCLLLRMPVAPPPQPTLAIHPFAVADVGVRFWQRFERCLARSAAQVPLGPITPASHDVRGTAEQAALVARLARRFTSETPTLTAVLADRGRGKSSALGLALREALAARELRVAVTAASADATREVLGFAPDVRFVTPATLMAEADERDVIVVDEAAQLPVPVLQRLVQRHPRARFAFASTVHGYEGTGRGFELRFLDWAARERTLDTVTLREPIRWDGGDPLERLVFDALALDAEPASVHSAGPIEHVAFDRDVLARDERTLRELFGLLVHAHYRTTPSDLHRLLDAANLAVHGLVQDGRVLAATLVAFEGGLSLEHATQLARGATRIRGHALPDTLVCHANRPNAGTLSMVRSVRIAVHPDHRRRGLARQLVDAVHQRYAPDLFGTLFGATPELLRFRREVGYTLVRVGASRGARTGEPSAVMVRPVSPRARTLVDELRLDLARDLPLQLALMDADSELRLDPSLSRALGADLPPPTPLTDAAVRAAVRSYLLGPRTYESAAFALTQFVEQHADALATLPDATLPDSARALIEGRVRHCHPWRRVTTDAGYPSIPAAMRALRRAFRTFTETVDPAVLTDRR